MKFTLGQWVNKENHTVNFPQQVYDSVFENNILTVYAPFRRTEGRSDTIDAGLMILRYSSPIEDIINVEVVHYEGETVKSPTFVLNKDDNSCSYTSCETIDDNIIFTSGKMKAVISISMFSTTYYYDNNYLTKVPFRATANIKNDKNEMYTREQIALSVGENVYGLGERFVPFIRNGQAIDMWNEDGGTSSEISYKNIPFYVTNKNYGVFVDNPGNVSFEVGSEHTQRVQFSVKGERLSYFVIGANDMKGVISNYTKLTGAVALPPVWTFGLWLSTSFTTKYDEATVMSFIDGMSKRNLPLHVFHFDCFWMKEFQLCDLEWDKDVFPDPAGMLSRIKAKGLKICVWINPYVSQKTKMFKEGMEHGYFIKKPNGDVFQWDRWQCGMALIDFTNPHACKWYKDKLSALIDMGVDSFKTDFGERIPLDVIYYDNSDTEKMHNFYTYLYNDCVFGLLKERLGEHNAAVFARSATAGGQKFPVHWGGDCWATYESMAESLRGGLSLCMSGFSFWSHDMGGFESTASPDVYKRWAAFGLLSSHSRLHGSTSYRVPWAYDEESVDVIRYFTNLKCSLMPYLFKNAYNSHITGVPMMRTMVLEYPNDPACKYIDTQYLLGDNLMVAPVFNKEGNSNFYLPDGTWTDFITNETVQGGRYINRQCDFMQIPLYAKQNSIIAVGNNDELVDYDFADNTVLHLFNLQDNATATTYIVDKTLAKTLCITATRTGNVISVNTCNANKPFTMLVRGNVTVLDCTNATFEVTNLGVKVTPKSNDFTITVL